jgi:hypothetical protein
MTTPATPKPSVGIGPTTIAGITAAIIGLAPIIVKCVEAGAIAYHGPEKLAGIAGVISLAITLLGRYAQSLKL